MKPIKVFSKKQKNNSRSKFGNKIRSGKIKRKVRCEICNGGGKIEAHHPDYSEPYNVIWLCKSHHGQIHYAGSEKHLMDFVKNCGSNTEGIRGTFCFNRLSSGRHKIRVQFNGANITCSSRGAKNTFECLIDKIRKNPLWIEYLNNLKKE